MDKKKNTNRYRMLDIKNIIDCLVGSDGIFQFVKLETLRTTHLGIGQAGEMAPQLIPFNDLLASAFQININMYVYRNNEL